MGALLILGLAGVAASAGVIEYRVRRYGAAGIMACLASTFVVLAILVGAR